MRNITKLITVAVLAGGMSLTAAPREANAVSLNLINTWEMGDIASYSNHITTANGTTLGQGPAWAKGGLPTPGINVHFGVGFGRGDQIVPYLGLSLHRASYNFNYDPDDIDDNLIENDSGNALQFGLEIGAKFFFIERAKGKAPPFLNIAFFKYFGSASDDDYSDIFGDEDIEFNVYDNQLLSPLGFKLSFGAEYYFNDNFAIGGEFFGLKFAYAGAKNPEYFDNITSVTQFSLYTSLTMTYRFSFTVRASVQFESDYDYED
jgi:hypothetical protein